MNPTPMNLVPCQYAIVRFLPYAETGEFANVGVVLACPAKGYFDFRLMPTRRTGRIHGFFEQLELKIYRDALKYMGEELERLRAMAANARDKDAVRQLFVGLVHPREALLRFGDTRVVMAGDPETMLEKLFTRFVERDFADKEYHEKLDRKVRDVLVEANLKDKFTEQRIGDDYVHINMPFVYLRGEQAVAAIKPLDLAKDDPNQVLETGGQWVTRIHRLRKHNWLPENMLFAVQEPAQAKLKARAAADEILADLREAGVKVEQADNANAIADFAKGVTLN